MPICPRGHESQAEDWCDFCGFPMTPPPGLPIPGAAPLGGAPAGPAGHPHTIPGGGFGAPPAPPAAPGLPDRTSGLVTCPICRTPQTGRFCEECRYDFELSSATRPPTQPAAGYAYPPPAQAPLQAPVQAPVQPPQMPPAPPMQSAPPAQPPAMQPPQAPPSPYQAPSPYEGQPSYEAAPPYEAPSPYEAPRASYEQPAPVPPYEQPAAPRLSFEKNPPAPPAHPTGAQLPGFPEPDAFDSTTGPVYAGASGDDFGTSFRLAPPSPTPPAAAPPASVRANWVAVVSADRDYFTDMMTRSGPDAAGLFFPPYCPERRIPITGRGQLRIGRRSQNRGTVPEIDLSVPPEDPGASHEHAILAEQADGSWVLVDQNSTNGTTVNGSPDTVPPHTAIPLNDGDRIHIGAWTTITLRRA